MVITSKNAINIIAFLILLVIFIGAFSSSYTSHNLTNLAYVLALGIDVGENAKIKLTAQFTKSASFSPNSNSSDESINIILISGEADSIYSCLNLLNSYIGKEINLAHCSAVIFSEDFAKNGISSQIYSLLNSEEFRPTTNLIISTCPAYEYLSNVKPNLEKITTNYYETYEITNKFTGYFANTTVGEFFNTLSGDFCDGTATLGGLTASARKEQEKSSDSESSSKDSQDSSQYISSEKDKTVITNPENLTAGSSSIQGKRGTENLGIAVFDNDKLCGKLTATESICHLLIENNLNFFVASIDNPCNESEKDKIELNIVPKKNSKFSVNIENDIPNIYLDINVQASILTLEKDIEYEQTSTLENFSIATKKYLEKQFDDYFNKISKDFGTDIDSFSYKALSHFTTQKEWKDYNWNEKFKSAQFHTNVNVNVVSSQMITKT